MAQVSGPDVVNIFKKVYGNIQDIQPEDYQLQRDIPFEQKQRVGESYTEAVVLTAESGMTWAGSGADAFELNPAIAGSVKQALVTPSITVLASVLPWGMVSRSATSEGAFVQATKHLVKNNVKSHGKYLEVCRWHGQRAKKLGYVFYGTETFRGNAFVNGTGTVGGVAFTNGVNAAAKAILLGRDYASGIWVGSEGVVVNEIDSTGAIVNSGKLVGTDSENCIIYVDYTPTAASSTTSHRVCFDGWENNQEALGVFGILQNSTSLFGISTSAYSLWKGNNVSCQSSKFTFDRLQNGVAAAVNRGGLEGDLYVYVNPRTWSTLVSTEAGKRQYDDSYTPNEAKNGFEAIVFHHQAGKAVIQSCRYMMENEVGALHVPDWSRSGSAEIGFTVPGGSQGEIIFPLENQAGYAFRSYADQYMFNHAPARSIAFNTINDESPS
jgi:hypothetical protein